MTDELRSKLERLRTAAPRLNAATDDAAAIVQDVDKSLDKMSLGISVLAEPPFREEDWVDDDRSGPRRTYWHLAYGRIGGRFRVHVVSVICQIDDDGDCVRELSRTTTAWSSLSRDDKLTSFNSLPDLLDALAGRTDELVTKAEGTSRTVRGLLDALREDAG